MPSNLTENLNLKYEIHEFISPVIHKYLFSLDQYIRYLDDGCTAFLFISRAGIRIHELYSAYLAARDVPMPESVKMFWASRISICKGGYKRSDRARKTIQQEFKFSTLEDTLASLLRQFPNTADGINLRGEGHKVRGEFFENWLDGNNDQARKIGAMFDEWGEALDEYIATLAGNAKRIVIIDSGWQGTAQQILSEIYSDFRWLGLYVGRTALPKVKTCKPEDVIGLLFEGERYDPSNPASSIVLHRHLIENLLESDGQSIEEIPAGFCRSEAEKLIATHDLEASDKPKDVLYNQVLEYIRDTAGYSATKIIAAYERVASDFAQAMAFPTRDQALALSGKDRSADFGRMVKVPVLLEPSEDTTLRQRMAQTLWPAGQLALEYSPRDALTQQRSLLANDVLSYFDPHRASAVTKEPGRVAIITRTKDRPVLLKRAAQSVASQIYKNYEWIVINDGGDVEVAREVIEASTVDPTRIKLVSNTTSQGMERASNIAISHSDSEFVVIHDDDDSWEQNFLKRTVEYLESAEGSRYGGVVTQSTYVSEEIDGDNVIIHARRPYLDWVRSIQLTEMSVSNMFAPIAFLYRKSEYERVGGYNEKLPVLGDWFFNLEFLLESDIGVLLEPLANYHHRDRQTSGGAYSNSVIGGRSKHEEFNPIMRNEFMRRNGHHPAASSLMSLGYLMSEVRNQSQITRRTFNDNYQNSGQPRSNDDISRLAQWIVHQINEERLARASRFKLALRKLELVKPDTPYGRIAALVKKYNLEIKAPSFFDEAAYLARHKDAEAMIAEGKLPNAFSHFTQYGLSEGRALR